VVIAVQRQRSSPKLGASLSVAVVARPRSTQQGGAAEPVSYSFQARYGQEFAAEWGDEPENRVHGRRSVLDAPLPSLPIAHYDDSPILLASRPRAR